MNRRVVARALVAASAAWLVALGCADDPHLRTLPGQGGGGACSVTAGQLPPPDCDDATGACEGEGCAIDEARCGSSSTCLPLGTNAGKEVLDFRLRKLKVAAPEALALEFIQKAIVTRGIELDAKSCGESGTGLFSWLLRIDRGAGVLETGGAPPTLDPFAKGFCFARLQVGSSVIQPVRAPFVEENGVLRTTSPLRLNIPIFLDQDLGSAIVLPISDARIEGVRVGDGGDCIGRLEKRALDGTCTEDPSTCSKWQTAGAIGGFITLEEADQVFVRDLGRTLCVVLSRQPAGPNGACARDAAGKLTAKGDFCSVDKQAGSCADAFWMAATFAASAAPIHDGSDAEPGCRGAVVTAPDAGADAEAGADGGDGGDVTGMPDGGDAG